jgi:histidinol-phosphate aminotransferase
LFARAAEVGPQLVYLANRQPMGTWRTGAALARAMDMLPWARFCPGRAYVDTAPFALPRWVERSAWLSACARFSKTCMAGARVGYAISALDLIYAKVRNHFGMNRAGQAGALAALANTSWHGDIVTKIDAARKRS